MTARPRALRRLADWLHVLLLIAAGLCYVACTIGILRRHSAAAIAPLLGVVLDLATRALGQLVVAPADVVVHDPSLAAQLIVPVALPLLLSLAAWPLRWRIEG
ncbi:MAG TPA: hypothetical protein VFX89_17130 [Gammaproteobacteria bacterium]|nr:hypothetical protein [Gammaproteobacteria bacterium]